MLPISMQTVEAAETLILFHQPLTTEPILTFNSPPQSNVDSAYTQLQTIYHSLLPSRPSSVRTPHIAYGAHNNENTSSNSNIQSLHTLCVTLSHITKLNLKAVRSIHERAKTLESEIEAAYHDAALKRITGVLGNAGEFVL